MKKKIRLAIISKADRTGGGASLVAEQLVKGLIHDPQYVSVHHWLAYPSLFSKGQTQVRLLHGEGIGQCIYKSSLVVSRTLGFPDFFTSDLVLHLFSKLADYDLYHFHDISTAFSPLALRWIAHRKPVVWTFHDFSPITGGCISPLTCKAFMKDCGKCPQLKNWPLITSFDFTRFMQRYKRRTAKITKLQPVTPSNWFARQVLDANWQAAPPIVIHNGIDTQIFRPFDKAQLRTLLYLPQNAFIILLSSMNLSDPNKGFAYALEAIKRLSIKPTILCIGHADSNIVNRIHTDTTIHFSGYIYDRRLLAQYYAAADILLFPSLSETFGNVIAETMACGVPTVAFSVTAIPELVEHDKTGWLAETKNTKQLLEGLEIAICQPERRQQWGVQARAKAVDLFGMDKFIQNHTNLYNTILNAKNVTA